MGEAMSEKLIEGLRVSATHVEHVSLAEEITEQDRNDLAEASACLVAAADEIASLRAALGIGAPQAPVREHEPIHGWFGLSYSSYLVIQRSVLQSMPPSWQRRFVVFLDELRAATQELGLPDEYWVRAREGNRFIEDPFSDYERGRRRVPLKSHQEFGHESEAVS